MAQASLNSDLSGISLVVQWLDSAFPMQGPKFDPGQGTKSYTPQLIVPRAAAGRSCPLQQDPRTIPHSESKTLRSQVNKL